MTAQLGEPGPFEYPTPERSQPEPVKTTAKPISNDMLSGPTNLTGPAEDNEKNGRDEIPREPGGPNYDRYTYDIKLIINVKLRKGFLLKYFLFFL